MEAASGAGTEIKPYAGRPIAFLGMHHAGGWRIKHYTITHDSAAIDLAAFERGISVAESTLPEPAVTAGRIGVGFLITHQGRGVNYIVLGWWDRENELPLRVFVSYESGGLDWRPAAGSESVCVWDLEVIWAERQAYVATVMNSAGADVESYLAAVAAVPAPRDG